MQLKTLFTIHNLCFDSTVKYRVGNITLSNQYEIRKAFYNPGFIERFGKIIIEENQDLVFGFSNHNSEQNETTEGYEIVFSELFQVSALLTFLWLVKDHSAYVSKSNTVYEDTMPKYIQFESGDNVWNANGTHTITSFSYSEFSKAVEIALKYKQLVSRKPQKFTDYGLGANTSQAVLGLSPTYIHDENNSIQRAFLFLVSARAQNYLPYRVAMYMPIFECLFTTDSQEVSHKVCERVSFYLRERGNERRMLYDDLKAGYAIRSKYLHGSKFKMKKIDPRQKCKG